MSLRLPNSQPKTEELKQTMDAREPLITVLTVTRRPENLPNCIRSVRAQTYHGPIRHLLVVDDNEDCRDVARREGVPDDDVLYQFRGPSETDGPARLAGLRNRAVSTAGDTWIAFLDDDNRWEASHLRSLWAAVVDIGADLAHSQRKIYEADGSPFLRAEFPWGRDELTRRAVYAYCLVAGIMSPGSNVLRDQMGMRFTWIDLGEWLFPPGFLQANPFGTTYDAWDWYNISVEDRDLPRAVFNSGMRVAATGQPTLHYFMGGYTNSTHGASVYWRRPPEGGSADEAARP
jgi:glycosyltransferase involved in cell wall biosynthesis